MCGIAAIAGSNEATRLVELMLARMQHRGPDGDGLWTSESRGVALGHQRLKILDLSDAGRQPMESADGRFVITFNGEVYNYLELRAELTDYAFRSDTDTEVVLAAWCRWGDQCLERLIGMFAFTIWDVRESRLIAVRDRFGVKPLYHARLADGGLALASEIKALHAAGVPRSPDVVAWATYLSTGLHEHSPRTFWTGVTALPAGCLLTWQPDREPEIRRWYDLAAQVGVDFDGRAEEIVREEYIALLRDSVRLRFRSDVPVGISLSGGLDSSTLLGVVHSVLGAQSDVSAFTFGTGDERYDELPWVRQMLAHTNHPLIECLMLAEDVPELASSTMRAEDEPFGGLPTLAYANLFRRARRENVIVMLDGGGMDEQWAGYDYYRSALTGAATPIVQGTRDPVARIDCLVPAFAGLAEPFDAPRPFPDRLRNLQYRDTFHTKIPRALRFNDRVSMASSIELREPFLDHRLFELAFRQPPERKITGDVGKRMLRDITQTLVPDTLRLAPKRPMQTPQREWLRGPLRTWAETKIEEGLQSHADWLAPIAARAAWQSYVAGQGDNSFWVWQWISLSL